jgi:tRNA G18 (ribose-2'-O)-methylase SpoU
VIIIDDPDDERVAPFRLNERGLSNRVQRRDDAGEGLFMAEGDLVVERALSAGCVPVLVLVDAQQPPPLTSRFSGDVPVYGGGERVRQMVTKLGMPHSIVALFERPPRPSVADLADSTHRLVVLEAVDNPVNVGSVVRNAAGLGWDGLVLDHTSADPLARRALRVSMGHALHLPHARTTALVEHVHDLASKDWQVVALTPDARATDLRELVPAHRLAVLIGSERAGLSADMLAASTLRARLPMHAGVDSLNAAAASAIACWALGPR